MGIKLGILWLEMKVEILPTAPTIPAQNHSLINSFYLSDKGDILGCWKLVFFFKHYFLSVNNQTKFYKLKIPVVSYDQMTIKVELCIN